MSDMNSASSDQFNEPSSEEIAAEVVAIINQRLEAKELIKLLQVVFIEVEEAAELLRVKKKTIQEWVSQDKIPFRRANGRVIFLLSELLNWTLPEKDKHARHRLTALKSCRLAASRLAATQEREK
jgi:excisionase family DNA binding protein